MEKLKSAKAIFIHYYFPPIHSIGALRNYYLCRAYLPFFKDIKILTTKNRNILGRDDSLATDDLEIIPIVTVDYRSFMGRYTGNTHLPVKSRSGLIEVLSRFKNSFPFNLIWGEGGLLYILFGVIRTWREIKKHNIQYIFTSFSPYADHSIAFILKYFRRDLIRIADFRDLHINPDRQNLIWYAFQVWCNKMILRRADIVTTVSKGLARELTNFYDNVQLLPNGIDLSLLQDREEPIHVEKFTICYTGSIYEGKQNPAPFLSSVKKVIENNQVNESLIQIIYAGKDSAKWKEWIQEYQLEDIFVDYGLVSRNQSIEIQRRSNLNLLLTWTSDLLGGILTAKLYEYIGSGSPIVVLVNGNGPDEDWEHMNQRINFGRLFYHGFPENQLNKYLVDLYQDWLVNHQRIHKIRNLERVEAFGWEVLVKKFLEKNFNE